MVHPISLVSLPSALSGRDDAGLPGCWSSGRRQDKGPV